MPRWYLCSFLCERSADVFLAIHLKESITGWQAKPLFFLHSLSDRDDDDDDGNEDDDDDGDVDPSEREHNWLPGQNSFSFPSLKPGGSLFLLVTVHCTECNTHAVQFNVKHCNAMGPPCGDGI